MQGLKHLQPGVRTRAVQWTDGAGAPAPGQGSPGTGVWGSFVGDRLWKMRWVRFGCPPPKWRGGRQAGFCAQVFMGTELISFAVTGFVD